MSALTGTSGDYLRLRRALGYKLELDGQVLPQLVALPRGCWRSGAHRRAGHRLGRPAARRAAAYRWPTGWASARGFAGYLQTIDPATEVPPCGVFCRGHRRPAPYLWSEDDIRVGCSAPPARSRPPLRAATHEALFGLLAATGMRVGEAIALGRDDVDLHAGVVTIRDAKSDRAAWCRSTRPRRRARPLRRRARPAVPASRSAATFFLTSAGTALGAAAWTRFIADHHRDRAAHPRPSGRGSHDLRHSFAVATLTRLAQGRDRRRGAHRRAVHLSRPRRTRQTPTGTCPRRPS